MLNIAVLVSGGGTNLQALIDAEKAGKIENGKISVVVASKPGVYALERAKNAGIEGIVLARSDYENVDAYSEALENLLKEKHTDLIVLAGFMTITNEKFTKAFENKSSTCTRRSFRRSAARAITVCTCTRRLWHAA